SSPAAERAGALPACVERIWLVGPVLERLPSFGALPPALKLLSMRFSSALSARISLDGAVESVREAVAPELVPEELTPEEEGRRRVVVRAPVAAIALLLPPEAAVDGASSPLPEPSASPPSFSIASDSSNRSCAPSG